MCTRVLYVIVGNVIMQVPYCCKFIISYRWLDCVIVLYLSLTKGHKLCFCCIDAYKNGHII